MSNDNIGKLKTFRQLLEEENTIIIPKVQRDYAYGRKEKKVEEVLDGMLTEILEAVRDDKSNILDFVYGSPYVHKNKASAGFIPLDGQQRLTTLFLIHFYASLLGDEKGNPIEQNEVDFLAKFQYETRQSATEFCTNLIKVIRSNLISKYKPSQRNLKELIIDDAFYLGTYDYDPTITSMLNVLERIEEKCITLDVLNLQGDCLWKRLRERKNIEFYSLCLEKFGLTDDLFIKMNARGKQLTTFEIFKSDMLAIIKKNSELLKDDFSVKLDSKWIDIVWDYTDKNAKPLDVTNNADQKYAMLFYNILRLEYYCENLSEKGYVDQDLNSMLCIFEDEERICHVRKTFDILYSIHRENGGFSSLWEKYFYFSDNITSENENRIRLFWEQKQKQKSVFELAMNGELTIPELVYLYASLLLYEKDDITTKRCLRIIRNLMTGSVRASDARTEKLHRFLKETKYIIEHKGIDVLYNKETDLIIDGCYHNLAFLQNVWNEEYKKQVTFNQEDYEKLIRYENHQILQCSLSLFMDYCQKDKLDTQKLFKMLEKFETIYDNRCYEENFQKIRTALLDSDIEYMQYDPYMERGNDSKEKWRYFITKISELRNFYIKTAQRRNQNGILQMLEKMPIPSEFLSSKELYNKFGIGDWRYYITKYPQESNIEWTKYGIGVWENIEDYPLDLILLNSSAHSENNLEWMMMTHLLWELIGNHEKYTLDHHGCSPILLTDCGASTIQFKEGKWLIHSRYGIIKAIKAECHNYIINEANEDSITVGLPLEPEIDYIDLGKKLIAIIENECRKD